jgi:hypothetical protein
MQESTSPQHRLRSIGAIVAGLLATVVLSVGTDAALQASGVFPRSGAAMTAGMFLLASAYRFVYGAVGGYVTAALAPRRPLRHALILGGIGLLLSLLGVAASWGKEAEMGPLWYPLLLVLTALPSTWLGARLRKPRGEATP